MRLRARYAPDLARVGAVPQPLYWIRCRVEGGTPDEPPVLTDAVLNAVVVEQRVPVRQSLPLAPGAVLETPPLQVGKRMRLEIEADEHGRVTRVQRTHSRQVPKVRLLAADSTALELTLTLAGLGDGNPEQQLDLAETAVADGAIAVWSYEADGPHAWQPRLDFDAAAATDRVVVLDRRPACSRSETASTAARRATASRCSRRTTSRSAPAAMCRARLRGASPRRTTRCRDRARRSSARCGRRGRRHGGGPRGGEAVGTRAAARAGGGCADTRRAAAGEDPRAPCAAARGDRASTSSGWRSVCPGLASAGSARGPTSTPARRACVRREP